MCKRSGADICKTKINKKKVLLKGEYNVFGLKGNENIEMSKLRIANSSIHLDLKRHEFVFPTLHTFHRKHITKLQFSSFALLCCVAVATTTTNKSD